MRFALSFAVFLAAIIGLSPAPALAGTVGVADGKVTWESTTCTAPTAPASILTADRHSAADDVNTKVTQYNQYAAAAQAYMTCLSTEAENDANATSAAVANAAKQKIDAVHQTVTDLGKPLQGKGE